MVHTNVVRVIIVQLTCMYMVVTAMLPSTSKPKKRCCLNGGRCVLGSFCICPKEYSGRRCQLRHLTRPCGPIKHKGWLKSDCSLCFCFDSRLTCQRDMFAGCENKLQENTANPLDKSHDLTIWPPVDELHADELKGDNYYDYDSFDEKNGTNGSRRIVILHSRIAYIVLFMICNISAYI